jgi:hypothetical protein
MSKAILTGTVEQIFPSEIRGSFEKRVIWLRELAGDRKNVWAIEFQQGDANKVDDFKLKQGERLAITVEVKGFKHTTNGNTYIIHSNKYVDLHRIDNTKSVTYT